KNWEHAAIPHGLIPSMIMPNKIDPILSIIQYTTFADGSVALGFGIHHQIIDGFGLFTFIENWGRRARLEPTDPPINDRNLLRASGNPPTYVPYEYFVIEPTEGKFSNAQKSLDLTNDALVAHFWRTTTRARTIDLNTEVFCSFALDGRDRLNPSIPKNYYGNVVCPKMLVSQLINGSPSSVALPIRKAVTDINNSRMRSIINWIEQQPDKSLVTASIMYNGEDFGITNWSKFQKHDLINFGDGSPIKQRCGREFAVDGLYVILGIEDGIEVYVSLQTEKLEILERDPEI
ncbi:32123_t:CDS:2, partial [Gigaspora margarita]